MTQVFHYARTAIVAAMFTVAGTAHADAPFQRFRLDPHGRVAGLLLSDGTEIPASEAATATLARSLHPGESVRVTYGPTGESILALQGAGQMVDLGNANTPLGVTPDSPAVTGRDGPSPNARGGGPRITEAVPYAPVDDARGLARLTTQGHVVLVTHTASGVPTGFVLDNGVQVSVVPSVAGMIDDVRQGELLRVSGRGTSVPQGTGLWATSIVTTNRGVILDMNRGPGPVELRLPRGG